MTASMKIKGLLAGVVTFALIGTAMAQGATTDKSKSAPIGAGQQSTQGTPMGTTGTPGGAPAMKPSMNSSTAAAPSSSMTTSSGGSAAGSTMSSDTSMASNTGARQTKMKHRRARADRN
jgi:hypothetical protein